MYKMQLNIKNLLKIKIIKIQEVVVLLPYLIISR